MRVRQALLAAVNGVGVGIGVALPLLGSAENLEAITAFFEKRPPDFSKL